MPALQNAVIWINRLRNRASSRRYPPENVLVLLPHCLQHQACKEPVKEAIRNCKGCGRCKMKELRALAERIGVRVHVASGGREALERARRAGGPRHPGGRVQQGTLRGNPRRVPEARGRHPEFLASRPLQGHRRGRPPG